MERIVFSSEYFNIADTLNCGQVFRFIPYKKGYKVFSNTKICYCYEESGYTVIETDDKDYFYNYFDLDRDYSEIYSFAIKGGEFLSLCADKGKGIRILNQDKTETLFSFIISQNNNIPRIKNIIEKLCLALGEKKFFLGEEYYSFPSVAKLSKQSLEFYRSVGLGYRAEYIKNLAEQIANGLDVSSFSTLNTSELKNKLISLHGVGPKVADCVAFFGFHRTDSFPVDTWIEKVYVENFNGTIKDRKKIAEYFVNKFKDKSGYIQQYLFHYKRNIEK